jgi:MFS family permease
MGVIGLINTLTINAINFPTMSRSDDLTSVILYGPKRPLVEIMMQPSFIISCSCATLAHTIMIMIMSDVELAMSADDFSLYYCSLVMELHFFAMFSPGFISGYLIDSLGSLFVAIIGGIIFAASLLVMGLGQNLFNYTFGMILVGIGWNLSFSTGTVMLTSSYNRNEATDVQAVNDFFLFSIAGSSSFLSGYIYEEYGWVFLIYIMAVFVACYLTLFFAAWYLQTGRNKENDDKILVTANIDNNSIASYRSVSSVSQHDRDDNVSLVRTISVA